jgi:DNA-binding SARP family transcriptional activator/uncharacterized protein YukE
MAMRTSLSAASGHPGLATLATAQQAADLIPADSTVLDALVERADTDTGRIDEAMDLARVNTEATWSGAAAEAFQQAHARYLADAQDIARSGQEVRHALAEHCTAVQTAHQQAAKALRVYRTARAQYAAATAPGAELASNAGQQQQIATSAMQAAQQLLDRARGDLAVAADSTEEAILRTTEALRQTQQRLRTSPATPQPPPTEVVRSPLNGVHDSLWRIAQRRLGAGQRWPEIYHLNAGHTFPDGRLLANPTDIQPGWTLTLPPTPTPPTPVPPPSVLPTVPPHPGSGYTVPPPISGTVQPGPSSPATPGQPPVGPPPITPPVPSPAAPAHPIPTPAVRTNGGGGLDLGGGLVLAGGIAATLTGIALAAGIQHRYTARRTASAAPQPGPVVRRLTTDLTTGDPRSVHQATTDATRTTPGPPQTGGYPGTEIPLGHRDGRSVLIDAAATLGLGLTGPGALDAARAVLISALVSHPDARGVLTADDSRRLLNTTAPPPQPSSFDPRRAAHSPTAANARTGQEATGFAGGRITVVDTPAAGLDQLEATILTRTRLLEETGGQHTADPLVLIATAPTDSHRLQAVTDLGAGLSIVVVVLGDWPAGITCYITTDGRISDIHGGHSSGWTAALVGLRVFTAGVDATQELLALLGHTSPVPTPSGSTAPELSPDKPSAVTARVNLGETAAHPDNPSAASSSPALAQPLPARTPTGPPEFDSSTLDGQIAQRLTPDSNLNLSTPPVQDIRGRLAADPAVQTPAPRRSDGSTPQPSAPHRNHRSRPVRIVVIGRLQVHYHPTDGEPVDLTEALAPRQCDIVVYLALHADGVRRETLTAALWPDAPGDRPYNSFHATLSQMRRAIRKATDNHVDTLTVSQDGYYALHPNMVDVDLWHMNDALHARRHAATERERTAALHQIAQLYRGELAETVHGDWIDAPREALRRDVLDALAVLIRIVRENDPEHTLELLEQARNLDPHNEAIYRDIIRTQAQLGYHDSIPRTLALLRTALAEVDTEPSANTLALAAERQRIDTSTGKQAPRTGSGRPSSNAPVPPRPRQSGHNGV